MHHHKSVRFSDEERNKYRSIRSVYSTYSAAATVSPSLYSGAATVPPSIYSADPTEIHGAFSTDESLHSAAQTVIFDMTDKGKDDNKEASDVVQKEKTSTTTNMQSKIRDDIKRNIKNHENEIAMAVGVEDDISSKISSTTDDISAAYGKQEARESVKPCNPPLMRRISHVNYVTLSLASILDPRLTPASNSKCGSTLQQRKASSFSSGSTGTSSISSASEDGRVWKEVLDRNTFKTYYYNIQTKEVTWTRPADFSSTYESDTPSEVESASTGSTLRRMNVLSAMKRFLRRFETPEETPPLDDDIDVTTVSILDEDSDRVEISPLYTPVVDEGLTKQRSGHPPVMNKDDTISNEDLPEEDTNTDGSGQAKLLVKDDKVEHNEVSPVVGNELVPIETSVSLTGGEEDTVCLDILFTCDPFRTY